MAITLSLKIYCQNVCILCMTKDVEPAVALQKDFYIESVDKLKGHTVQT